MSAFSNLALLTGSAFASNWLINQLNLSRDVVKSTKMTTNSRGVRKTNLSALLEVVMVTRKENVVRAGIEGAA